VEVNRLKLPTEAGHTIRRIVNAIRLGIKTTYLTIKQKPDVIIATSIPPILGGFFAAVASKITRSRLIYFVMDIHPEIGRVSGDFSNAIVYKSLELIDRWTCQTAHTVILHSQDMRAALLSRNGNKSIKIKILNNFAIPSSEDTSTENNINIKENTDLLTIIYAGNVGRFQGLENVIELFASLNMMSKVQLIIMGNGYLTAELEQQAKTLNANIRFIPQQKLEIAKLAIAQADLGLISLLPDVYKYAYPGKTMTYLEQGTPLLALLEPHSEIAESIKDQSYGFVINPTDRDSFKKQLTWLATNKAWKVQYRKNARNAFERNFSASKILTDWERLIVNAS
jgi:glycosyltransferase involved in cell wall biosynthesis